MPHSALPYRRQLRTGEQPRQAFFANLDQYSLANFLSNPRQLRLAFPDPS